MAAMLPGTAASTFHRYMPARRLRCLPAATLRPCIVEAAAGIVIRMVGAVTTGAQLLRMAIVEHGRVEGDLIMVDDFLNHRVDPVLMAAIGSDLASRFSDASPDLVLTAEASGIPPALACALHLSIPMVFAKKYPGPGRRLAYSRTVLSPTRQAPYQVEVACRALPPNQRVLVIDDFLSNGHTAEALGEITEEAGCEVTGFGFAVEKSFREGRARLLGHGWRVEALVRVLSADDSGLVLAC
jgi:xanthine phosphoribosyltransferase